MATWDGLLTDIREELKDKTKGSYRWSDALLYTYLKAALADYSLWFPLRVDREELTPVSGVCTLPDNFVDAIEVECPQDRFLEQRRPRPGLRYPTQSGRPFYYYVDGGNLYLCGSPLDGEKVYLTYEALHPAPEDEYDSDHAFTFPDRDEELIRLYIIAKCYEQIRSRQASLDRFDERGSNRQDNPLQPEVKDLMEEYLTKVALRVGGGSVRLHRTGRTR